MNDIRLKVHSKGAAVYNVYIPFSEKRERVYFGNGKTFFPSIGNFIAGNGMYTGLIPDCIKACNEIMDDMKKEIGTCPCNCPGCYAKNCTMYINTFLAYYQNTIEMKEDPDRYWKMVAKNIRRRIRKIRNKGGLIRVNDSGDLYSIENVIALRDNVIREFPDLIFYGYSEFHLFADILNECENAVFWKSDFTNFKPGTVGHTFVDDGTNTNIINMVHCPAIDENGNKTGKKCNECLICTKKALIEKISFAFTKH